MTFAPGGAAKAFNAAFNEKEGFMKLEKLEDKQNTELGKQSFMVEDDNYLKIGDWHDTLLFDSAQYAWIRYKPQTFGGEYMMVHCHNVGHADKGMMTVEKINF